LRIGTNENDIYWDYQTLGVHAEAIQANEIAIDTNTVAIEENTAEIS